MPVANLAISLSLCEWVHAKTICPQSLLFQRSLTRALLPSHTRRLCFMTTTSTPLNTRTLHARLCTYTAHAYPLSSVGSGHPFGVPPCRQPRTLLPEAAERRAFFRIATPEPRLVSFAFVACPHVSTAAWTTRLVTPPLGRRELCGWSLKASSDIGGLAVCPITTVFPKPVKIVGPAHSAARQGLWTVASITTGGKARKRREWPQTTPDLLRGS